MERVRAQQQSQRGLDGILLGAASSAVLFGVPAFLPALAPMAALCPLPMAMQRLRGTAGSAAGAAVAATAALAVILTPGRAAFFLIVLAAPGLLIGEAMARGRGLLRGCAWAFLAVLLVLAVMMVFAPNVMMGVALEPFAYYDSPRFQAELREAGVPAESVEAWGEEFGALHRALQVVWPAAYVIMGALLVLVNAVALRAYLARRDPGWLDGGEFEGLRWPLALPVAFVACGLAVTAPLLRPAAYNGLLVLAFFFGLQGLAVVLFYARRLAAPPLLRLAALLLVVVNPWAPQILALLGLFDQWFNVRRWAEAPPPGQA